ncbi:MAG: glycosyltransferase family 2 protein [Myxacorys californica WJT36-NPBG1]|jgi:glycosyltransferase involved in cell wall biosynthesis|nr:glycosyltransferase family 2 protein [Myxacorys californica WJT36-NPBG1]
MKLFPTITIAIPTYNEAQSIEKVIQRFLKTKYSNAVEILVADGGSTDGTQLIVHQISSEDSRVKLLHNPLKIQAAGLNLILQHGDGEVFLRADAHSDYAPDYIERCVEALLRSEAVNVGGAQRFVAKNAFQAGVALSSKTWLGNGGAKYRNPKYDGYADTAYLGCFWRKDLLNCSGYSSEAVNEDAELNIRLSNTTFALDQVTNQDSELNQRLEKQSSKAIYISSKICVWYYPRSTWKALLIQYFKYGRGRFLTTTKHKKSSLRGRLPFLVISCTIALLMLDILTPQLDLPIEQCILLGVLLPFLESLRVTLEFNQSFSSEFWRGDSEEIPSFLSRWFFCGVSLLTMPIAHFLGYAYQLVRRNVFSVRDW